MIGAAVTSRQSLLAIGSKQTKGGVGKAAIEVTPNDFLGFFAFEGINPNTHIIAGGFDDLFLAELTVLRRGVARSKDA